MDMWYIVIKAFDMLNFLLGNILLQLHFLLIFLHSFGFPNMSFSNLFLWQLKISIFVVVVVVLKYRILITV